MHKAISHWKAKGIDLSRILYKPEIGSDIATYNCEVQNHGLEKALDLKMIEKARPALENRQSVRIETEIRNTNRTFGAMLSGEVAKRYGHMGLPEDTISILAKGTAGQSFGSFVSKGISIELQGEGNDYVGKGLSGGRLVIYPPKECSIVAEDNIIVGNTVLYGAVSGECYFRGFAGERFAVRNSGAIAVIEGVGDHGCEYMTGGIVLVLGPSGRNFAAGMSGGIAYVLDEQGDFEQRCNMAMVELEPIPIGGVDEAVSRSSTESCSLDGVMDDLTCQDEQRLRKLLENHLHYTGSTRAREILDNWADYLPKFIKVMPVDYRRALEQMKKEQDQMVNKQIA
jgi:glutamate synthase (NADPH/NADH) large chain